LFTKQKLYGFWETVEKAKKYSGREKQVAEVRLHIQLEVKKANPKKIEDLLELLLFIFSINGRILFSIISIALEFKSKESKD
jgi:hypothetical protein